VFGRLGHVDQELTPDQDRALAALLAVALVGLPQLDRTFRERGLVHVEFGLLDALAGQPAGWRLSDLAHTLNMSPSRLTHRMRKLVDRGYVRQYPSPNDGRGTIAEITPEGRALLAEIAPIYHCQVRQTLFAHLTAAQTKALANALTAVAEGLGAVCAR